MFKEFSTFQKAPEKMSNSKELMLDEAKYVNGFVIEAEAGELLAYTTCFLPISLG